ncbi:MAG: flagellar biosynthetic protein FliO [Synergistetes bacterium]|nr:flagellar biosynthetic protein FliO [Synergistota bacterium]
MKAFFFLSIAWAADKGDANLKLPGFGELLVKSIVALVIVVGIILLFSWYIKGYLRKSRESDFIKILDRIYLDNRRFLCLVKVGEKIFLLGVGDGGVNLIAEMEKVTALEGEEVQIAPSFRKHLERFLGKR